MRSILLQRKQGSKQICPSPADIKGEVADQPFGRVKIDRVVERPPLPFDPDKARGREIGQMMRQGVLFQAKRLGDLCRAHASRGKTHEKAKDSQPAGMAKGGKGMNGAIVFHISRLMEI